MTSFAIQSSAALGEFMQMIRTRRPHGSKTEAEFIKQWIDSIPGMTVDGAGNRIIRIGDSPIAWSSHTDTVHHKAGSQATELRKDIVSLSRRGKANCLGADCTTGIWIMRHMILRKVPGLYIFHRGEEVGGIGSNHIATHTPGMVDGIQAMIALDRKGYNSIITHQFNGRTASDEFARSLSRALGGNFVADDTGTFTDSANYAELIPECTNLSVGYFSQHTAKETQDIAFMQWLLEKLCLADFSKLEYVRDPAELVDDYFTGMESDYTDFNIDRIEDLDSEIRAMTKAIDNYPELTARLLSDYGIGIDELWQYIYASKGV